MRPTPDGGYFLDFDWIIGSLISVGIAQRHRNGDTNSQDVPISCGSDKVSCWVLGVIGSIVGGFHPETGNSPLIQ